MRARLLPLTAVLSLAACHPPQESPPPENVVVGTPVRTEALPPLERVDNRSSQFTPLDAKDCMRIEEDKETGDWSARCLGLGMTGIELNSSDLRDDLTIVQGRKRTALKIPQIVAKGAFDSLGKTLEWRGPAGGTPDVLVVRVKVAGPDGKDDSGRLVVVRLDEPPCIVAAVPPSSAQSAKARAIADGKLPHCLAD